MTKPQTGKQHRRLKTSEMVVYPMLVVILIGVTFGFYHNSKIEDAVSAAVSLGLEHSCRGLFRNDRRDAAVQRTSIWNAFTAGVINQHRLSGR